MSSEEGFLELEKQFTAELEAIRDEVLVRAVPLLRVTRFSPRPASISLHSFHAKIGRWNTIFVDSIRVQFSDPNDFLSRWVAGLLDKVERIEAEQKEKYNGKTFPTSAEHEVVRFVKEPTIQKYIFTFLTRNFYRNFQARTRAKPDDMLWQIWFGRGSMTWGVLLAPAYRRKKWTNDVSEIRRADYHYWTVGHILRAGLVDPTSPEPITFSNLEQFIAFYRSVLKRESNSIYEQAIADRYVAYLKASSSPESEPFLVPELRYGGMEAKHEHRLDYTVLNSHTMELTGFELSPASTHMAISGIQKEKKTQIEVNREIAEQWENEMAKRNKYFDKFSVPIITFTDSMLKDIDQCFAQIANKLAARNEQTTSLKDALQRLERF